MRAWALYYGLGFPENQKAAVREFERALEIDSGSIDAKLGIARVLVGMVGEGLSGDVEGIRRARSSCSAKSWNESRTAR